MTESRPLRMVLSTALTALSLGVAVGQTTKKAVAPVWMTECEGGTCGTWNFLNRQGRGQWPNGDSANLVFSFEGDTVIVHREDLTGTHAGLTATYRGTRDNDGLHGKFTSSWPDHWDQKSGDWHAVPAIRPPGMMRNCPIPRTTCSTWTWNSGHYDFLSDNGTTGTVTVVDFTPESVVLKRVDYGKTAGYSATYTGKLSTTGDEIVNGTWSDSNNHNGHFEAAWGAAVQKLPSVPTGASQPQVTVTAPRIEDITKGIDLFVALKHLYEAFQ